MIGGLGLALAALFASGGFWQYLERVTAEDDAAEARETGVLVASSGRLQYRVAVDMVRECQADLAETVELLTLARSGRGCLGMEPELPPDATTGDYGVYSQMALEDAISGDFPEGADSVDQGP